jgi:hypothetical protein
MIRLADKDNVNAPSAQYPYGDARNKTSLVNGTKWDREMMSDIIQTSERIFALSGKTANGITDNATDGFQLYDALQTIVSKKFVKEISTVFDEDNITITRTEIETAFGAGINPFKNGFFGTATTSNTLIDFNIAFWRKDSINAYWTKMNTHNPGGGEVWIKNLRVNSTTGDITFTISGGIIDPASLVRVVING